jgi:cyanophycinase
MSRRLLLALSFAFLLPEVLAAAAEEPRGHLVVAGGGKMESVVFQRALALAGGVRAVVAILPQASELPDTGANSAAMWRELGARDVAVIDLGWPDQAQQSLRTEQLIWMPGGDQNKLMAALNAAGVAEAIRTRYREGAVVGGTSVGAAVISGIMLTDEADLRKVAPSATRTAPGLALWPEVIVDQHFLARQRFNRLLGAVLDHPERIGVGIDEGTAVLVSPGRWEVLGASSVMILDARRAVAADRRAEAPHSASDVRLHVLRAGQSWPPPTGP